SGDAKFQSTENDEYKQNSKSVNDSDNSDLEQNPDSITANEKEALIIVEESAIPEKSSRTKKVMVLLNW
ncbi:1243_t:CDS:2, partial [Gigaspora rosea]